MYVVYEVCLVYVGCMCSVWYECGMRGVCVCCEYVVYVWCGGVCVCVCV